MVHEFGGEWTDLKLDVMDAYFRAYATALKNQRFECWYVDAFAGTGERAPRGDKSGEETASLFGEEETAVSEAKAGSVRRALEIDPPFARYIFIERSRNRVERLNELQANHPVRKIEVVEGDANEELVKLCEQTNWTKTRAAVFIDPYGMQVNWSTLERLAKTRAVDIALLFPTGSLNRLLRRDGDIPNEWALRIDNFLGPREWRSAFYQTAEKADLFDTAISTEKNVDLAGLQSFAKKRLRSIFAYVHEKAVPLVNTKGSVLYDLFIICANPSLKATSLAKRLANGAIRAATLPKG